MKRRPKFHIIDCEEYLFCCQSTRVPIEEPNSSNQQEIH